MSVGRRSGSYTGSCSRDIETDSSKAVHEAACCTTQYPAQAKLQGQEIVRVPIEE